MIVQCPHCPARLNIPPGFPAESPIRCSRCQAVFQVPAEPIPVIVPVAPAIPVAPEVPDNLAAPTAFPPIVPDIPEATAAEEPPVPVASAPEGADLTSWANAEPEPQPDAKTTSRKRRPQPEKKFPILLVGGVLVAVAVVVGMVIAFSGPPKPDVASNPEPTPPPVPKKEGGPPRKGGDPRPNPPQLKAQIPPEYAELFAETVNPRPAPTVLVPSLQKIGREELSVPGFAAKTDPAEDGGKMTIEELKKASTFLKVSAGDTGGTGSGFVIRAEKDTLLVATNFHVVSPRTAQLNFDPPTITVVFDSGQPTEWERPGEVIATEPEIDLAIVRVTGAKQLPKPINPHINLKLMETMEVRICGFPFGQTLTTGGRNPSITIGKGTVSRIQTNTSGTVERVQLDGSLNPGNSGGPIVDLEGRLVGIAVATIKGSSGIGLAIPAHELSSLIAGKVSPPVVLPVGLEGNRASFKVLAAVSDPLQRMKSLTLHVWNGATPPEPERDPATGWKLIEGAEQIPLRTGPGVSLATGDFRLPAPENKTVMAVLQLECRSNNGVVTVSPPVTHKLVLDGVQTASDAIPMDTFRTGVGKYAGQVIAVRGKLSTGTPRRGAVYEIPVSSETNSTPQGLVFVADRNIATQLNELTSEELALPVRLTVQVGKTATAGVTPVRVTQIDFIGRSNRLVNTIPEAGEPRDPLVALNRSPEKRVGQTLTLQALLSPAVLGSEKEPELSILLDSGKRPENLHFTTSPGIAAKLKEPAMQGEWHFARLTLRVENNELGDTGARVVTVLKIEILGRDGFPRRILE